MSAKTAQARRPAAKAPAVPKKSAKRTASTLSKGVAKQPRKFAVRNGKAVSPQAVTPQAMSPAEISHRLHLLLHSIHQIERYEERLCSIEDAIRRTGRVSSTVLRDLQTLIQELPSDEFMHDLDAVRNAVRP